MWSITAKHISSLFRKNVSGKITEAYLSSIKTESGCLYIHTHIYPTAYCLNISIWIYVNYLRMVLWSYKLWLITRNYFSWSIKWNSIVQKLLVIFNSFLTSSHVSLFLNKEKNGIWNWLSALTFNYFDKFYFSKWCVVLVNQKTHSNVKEFLV